ncbi:MAG: hypothetical protein JWR09_4125, partial [Mucilaginibacter sp.]|nr:hypothetical protein [Mucilaginibacter sp.]
MKVRFIVTGAIIVLITCAFFYPVTQQASITINASMFNVYSQL